MVKALKAIELRYPQLLWLVYVYTSLLIIMVVAALMGLGGFDFALITYTTPGFPGLTVTLAAVMIFALPFLLRLPLTPLARFFSALFTIAAPAGIFLYVTYLMAENIVPSSVWLVAGAGMLAGLGVVSFLVLNGTRALSFSKR